jgi:hypothetical protein
MKQLLLGGAMLIAIAASGLPARAVPFVFTYTGSLVTFVVPTTATYQILAFGAQGGSGALGLGAGGRGAEIGGDFSLTETRFCKSPSAALAAMEVVAVEEVVGASWSAQATRRW